MASVVRRLGYYFRGDKIIFKERPLSWKAADKIVGRHLDRRKNYTVINGQVCSAIKWTSACSGCSDGSADNGGGCRECGYQGRVRNSCWMPDDGAEPGDHVSTRKDAGEENSLISKE